ncbi:hypothetical protein V6Z12_A04G143300 [Gossypium hirsutum]
MEIANDIQKHMETVSLPFFNKFKDLKKKRSDSSKLFLDEVTILKKANSQASIATGDKWNNISWKFEHFAFSVPYLHFIYLCMQNNLLKTGSSSQNINLHY